MASTKITERQMDAKAHSYAFETLKRHPRFGRFHKSDLGVLEYTDNGMYPDNVLVLDRYSKRTFVCYMGLYSMYEAHEIN